MSAAAAIAVAMDYRRWSEEDAESREDETRPPLHSPMKPPLPCQNAVGRLLLAVVWAAALTGMMNGDSQPSSAPANVVTAGLIVLVAYTTILISMRDHGEIRELMITMLALFTTAVCITSFGHRCPVLQAIFQTIAVALATPCLAMCFDQLEWMHRLVAAIVVLPGLLTANFAPGLTFIDLYALLFPALIFISYKETIHITIRFNLYVYLKFVRRGICASEAAIFICTTVAGVAVALDMQKPMECTIAITLATAAGIIFNRCLMMQRWAKPNSTGNCNLKWRLCGIICVITLIFVDMIAIYSCLIFYRIAVIVPIILAICLYFTLVCLHEPIQEMTNSFADFLLILVCMACCATSFAIASSYHPQAFNFNNPTLDWWVFNRFIDDVKETKIRSEAFAFITLECALVFTYLMIIALFKTDKRAKEAVFLRKIERRLGQRLPTDASENGAVLVAKKEGSVENGSLLTHSMLDMPK